MPAALLAFSVTAALACAQVLPLGDATLLVRVPPGRPAAALIAAASSGAALVGIPAPGFVVLHGNASHIRATLGLATIWRGRAPCSSTP